jgi:hypothetical protein
METTNQKGEKRGKPHMRNPEEQGGMPQHRVLSPWFVLEVLRLSILLTFCEYDPRSAWATLRL